MRHVTLHWDAEDAGLRRQVEAALRRELGEVHTPDNPVAVWLLGRELFSADVGLLAAAFLAVSRWHVDFSRFGMAIVFPTLFVPLTLYLFQNLTSKISRPSFRYFAS